MKGTQGNNNGIVMGLLIFVDVPTQDRHLMGFSAWRSLNIVFW